MGLNSEYWSRNGKVQSFCSNFLLSPARQRTLVLDGQPKAGVAESAQSGREARETALRLVSNPGARGLARDGSKRFLRKRWQTHGPGVLCPRHAQAASASRGMVAGSRGSIGNVQKAVGRRLVLMQRGLDTPVGKIGSGGAVVERLLMRWLGLGVESRQGHGVVQPVLLLLGLLGGHLI